MKDSNYTHFLRYDQLCFDGIEYGFTDIAYIISEDLKTLYIRKKDHTTQKENDLSFSIPNPSKDDKSILFDFLINLMSYSGSFAGTPDYISSAIFTKIEFDLMLKKGMELMQTRTDESIKNGIENELIKYCTSNNLNPEPDGNGPNNWVANCPSGRGHFINISTNSNEWECGYCQRKGNLNDLKIWLREINKNK